MTNKKPLIVLASGAFDLVHYGHIYYLEEAKKSGGANARLIVIVARDRTIKRLKGRKPIISEEQRRALVEALKPVDEAYLGHEDLGFTNTIQKINPSIIAIGYDQQQIEEAVRMAIRESGLKKIKLIKIGHFDRLDVSSSKIKKKILNEWK
jgi:FAD synthetase